MAKTFTLLAALFIVFALGDATDAPATPARTATPPARTATPPATTATPPATTATPPATTATPPATTATPPANTTAEASTGSTATTVSGATKPPTTPTVPPTTQVPTTTEFPDACTSNPCGAGSTCEPRAHMSYVCLCLAGDFYDNVTESCQRAKVFPGRLGLTTPFEPDMANKKSAIFQKTSEEIISALQDIFSKTNKQYSGSTVLELRKKAKSKGILKTIDTEAAIEIIFLAKSDVTLNDVTEALSNINCGDCILTGSEFKNENLCQSNACDAKTTKCQPGDGSFTCSCLSGYIKTDFTDRICLECPSGYGEKDSECVECSFGYSGFNCEDSQLLGVVIAACVLGGLLLIAIIVIPIVAVKMKKKGSRKNTNEDFVKPYVSHSVAKIPAANSSVPNGMSSSSRGPAGGVAAPVGIPRIPRATGGANWDNGTNLEMTPSNSRQNLISPARNGWINDDQDDTFKFGQSRPQTNQYEQNRPQTNQYEQHRPQTNQYEQNRPQQNPYGQSSSVNPYAQRKGNSNPYYMSDDDRYSR